MSKRRIYLDFATTTPLDPAVARAMKPYWSRKFGNPSSLHAEGVEAGRALARARTTVARVLQAHPDEIVFTGSGTEANNLAISGLIAGMKGDKKPHIVTSVIEHSSVLKPIQALEAAGVAEVTYVPVTEKGLVDLRAFMKSLRSTTVFVSIMLANNEIGTIQPVRKIANLIRDFARTANLQTPIPSRKKGELFFHVDACQAPNFLDVDQDRLRADLITLDGHKLYGPKGVGALYVRRGTPLSSVLLGGPQERGLRAGTENVALVVGFAEALRLASARRGAESKRLRVLRDRFFDRIRERIPSAVVNGDRRERLPNNVNISIPGLNAEFAVLQLDAAGVACSSKSACLQDERASYVIKALGRNDGLEANAIRFTLGRSTTAKDVDDALQALAAIV